MPLMNSQGNGHLFIQATTPSGWQSGDFWYDTTNNLMKFNQNGTTVTCEITANKDVASGYAGLTSASKLSLNSIPPTIYINGAHY